MDVVKITTRVVTVLGLLLLLISSAIAAESFDGTLFFTAEERFGLDARFKEMQQTDEESQNHSSRRGSAKERITSPSRYISPLLSFDGIMGDPSNPRLWINKTQWSDAGVIQGVKKLHWEVKLQRLLVTLNNGREVTLAIGQCLMPQYKLMHCAAISQNDSLP